MSKTTPPYIKEALRSVTPWLHNEQCAGTIHERADGECCHLARKSRLSRETALLLLERANIPNTVNGANKAGYPDVADALDHWWDIGGPGYKENSQ